MRAKPDPQDAELLALLAQFRRGEKRRAAAIKALADAEERFAPPPAPAALLRRPEDRTLPFHPDARVGEPYRADDTQQLRKFLDVHKRAKRQLAPLPPEMRARILEIIAAADEFARADYAARCAAGEYRASGRFNRACYAQQPLCAKIGRTPATTAAGVLAKLVAASWGVATFPDEFIDDRQPEYMLASAVCDALTLAGHAPSDAARLAAIRESLGLGAA